MEHARCAQCRNPIRGRQARVQHARADMTFHADCWASLHACVQAEYVEQIAERGFDALVAPYRCAETVSWLPQAAIDEAVESFGEQLEQLSVVSVPVQAGEDRRPSGFARQGRQPVAGAVTT